MTSEAGIVVYVQPYCHPCHEVERLLAEQGVPFTSRDVSSDPDALAELAARGFMSTPVTRVGDTWIAGLSRGEIIRAIEERTP